MIGGREATGKLGSTGGFNSDVWVDTNLTYDMAAVF
jgi:hypothetical protein